MEYILFGLGILLVIALVSMYFRQERRTVDEGKQDVIFRMGRYQRVAGPGFITLSRDIDKVAHTINVRNEPKRFTVDERVNDVHIRCIFNVWCRTDIVEASRISGVPERDLVLFEDNERRKNGNYEVQIAFQDALRDAETQEPANPEAFFTRRLVRILPGLPPYGRLIADMTAELSRALPKIGYILDPTHKIEIVEIYLDQGVLDNIERTTTVDTLRRMFPEVAPEMLLQSISAIEGIDLPHMHTLVIDSNAPVTVLPQADGGEAAPPVIPMINQTPPPPAPPPTPPQAPGALDEILTDYDMDVLQTVPIHRG